MNSISSKAAAFLDDIKAACKKHGDVFIDDAEIYGGEEQFCGMEYTFETPSKGPGGLDIFVSMSDAIDYLKGKPFEVYPSDE